MKPSLAKRLDALESAAPRIVDAEQEGRMRAALGALFDSLELDDRYGPGKEDPLVWVHQPGTLTPLFERIQAGAVTDDDRALMATWPACHLTPEQLVELVVKVRDEY